MSSPVLRLEPFCPPEPVVPARPRTLADTLIASGAALPQHVNEATLSLPGRGATLSDALLAHGRVAPEALLEAEAQIAGGHVIDPAAHPADARLIDRYGAGSALRDRILPWRRVGATTVVLCARLADYRAQTGRLQTLFGDTQVAFASEAEIQAAILTQRRRALATGAETRVLEAESCRTIWSGRKAWIAFGLLLVALAGIVVFPLEALALAAGWAIVTLVLTQSLRLVALVAALTIRRDRLGDTGPEMTGPLPKVSLLVPLFREREIAAHLITRLERLDYPRELLDVCLVAEQNDTITRATIADAGVPPWMRLIVVPPGRLQTKPRAMNYALDFARGSIIGVYDAEDAPDPDQINRVVRRFAEAPADVACLQGVLDFYNARQNWLSRCFAIDYAAWFRIILPGLSRMRLVIPLGGTTLFFRRTALDRLGGWDAHNVTEDADLGIRLARRGYRTELIPSVTEEEANCRVWPWVRQRSRWLKGYAITYAVHMRRPMRLLGDLGPWRFLGFQILFFGTLSQFVLAPVLWSFWMIPLGLSHPLEQFIPGPYLVTLALIFVGSEVINIAIGSLAVSGPRHRWLTPWVPTLHFYWPLGAIASYKALWEVARNPFYWDKTAHGVEFGAAGPETRTPPRGQVAASAS